jgi:hypothetical protein
MWIFLNVLAIITYWYGLHLFKGRINYWIDINTRITDCGFCRGHAFGIITGLLIAVLAIQLFLIIR